MADADLLGNLADACLKQADALQDMQAALNYQGPQIATLYANETALRSKVLMLNTAAVAAALQASKDAQTSLKNGTKAANDVVGKIKTAEKAIQISADLIGLAASALSGNVQGAISSASQLIDDATKQEDNNTRRS